MSIVRPSRLDRRARVSPFAWPALRDPLCFVLAPLGLAALVLRILWLDTMPGLNGDEAWYGVWALRCLHQGVCALHTPSGNFINPFYMVLVVAVHAVLSPSTIALRAPAVLCGIALPAAGYGLLRAPLGRLPAAVFAILSASLPVDIAYSRFGWDASQLGLATTLALAFALRGNRILAWAAWGAAFCVHPTAIFLLPMLVITTESGRVRMWLKRVGRAWSLAIIAAAVLAVTLASWRLIGVVTVGSQPGDRSQWVQQFARGFVALFSGSTIEEYIVGSPPSLTADLVAALCLTAGSAILLRKLLRRPWSRDSLVFLSFIIMLIGFAAVAGPGALAPGWERYGVVLVVPVLLLSTLAIRDLFGAENRICLWVAGGIGWLAVAGFLGGYMIPLATGGGRAANPATTGSVEPKRAAAAMLQVWAKGESRLVAADEWWTYEPLVYFLWSTPSLQVTRLSAPDAANADYAVTLPGGEDDRRLAAERQPADVIRDLAGRPAINLWRLKD